MKIKYEREQRGAKVFTKNEFVEKEKWFEKEIRPSLKGSKCTITTRLESHPRM